MSAHLRTLVVLAATARIPLVTRLVCLLTPKPHIEVATVGGIPSFVARPQRVRGRDTVVFLNGGTALGCAHPAVQRLIGGLARAGHVVVAPELPGLKQGVLTAATLETAQEVAREAARGTRIVLLGVSAGAAVALLVAADPELEGRVSLVVSVAPWADLAAMVELALTGSYRGRRETTTELVRTFVGASLREIAGGDPAVERLLRNRDPARFATLAGELPEAATETLACLSPLHVAERVAAPVELVSAADDGYFPLDEAESLQAALPSARLTVTSLLDHVRLTPSARDLRDLAHFWRLTARTLAAAAGRSRRSGPPAPTGAAQPLRFLGIGAAGYVVALMVFALLYAGGAPYTAASIAAYLSANGLMYLGNRYFTFRLGHEGFLAAYGRYLLVGLLVAGLNALLLSVLVERGGVDARFGQAISLLLVTPVAFVLFKRWTFRLRAA